MPSRHRFPFSTIIFHFAIARGHFFRRMRQARRVSIRLDSIRCDAMRCDSIRFDSIRFDPIRFDSIRFDSSRLDPIRSDSIRSWIRRRLRDHQRSIVNRTTQTVRVNAFVTRRNHRLFVRSSSPLNRCARIYSFVECSSRCVVHLVAIANRWSIQTDASWRRIVQQPRTSLRRSRQTFIRPVSADSFVCCNLFRERRFRGNRKIEKVETFPLGTGAAIHGRVAINDPCDRKVSRPI